MANPLYKKHILSIADLTRSDLELVVQTASRLKQTPRHDLLQHKVIASCFLKPPPEPASRLRQLFIVLAALSLALLMQAIPLWRKKGKRWLIRFESLPPIPMPL